jgi:hypothetical protein
LIQRFTAGNPTAPSGIAIIGPGETAETFCQHYYDSRGAARIYQMSLTDGVWEAVARGPRLLAALHRGVLRRRQDDQERLAGLSGRAAAEARL